jgi:polyisoprenoid-binding protein YceI
MASSPTTPSRTSSGTATYQIDPSHSVAEFVVKHLMFSTVKGRFSKVSGEIKLDEADPTNSSVSAEADVASVDTGDPKRDGHLRSPDFFEAEKYPALTFISRRVERAGNGDTYRVVGDLTIRDVTREVTFDTTYLGQGTDPWGGTRVGFSATTTINRKDFGLNWNAPLEAGGVLVSDQVRINLEVQAVKQG